MAKDQLHYSIGTDASAADLSGNQFYGAKMSAAGWVLCSVLGEPCDGIIQDGTETDKSLKVEVSGRSKAVAGAAVAKGALVTVNAAGKFITAASGHYIFGRAMEAAAADGDIFSVLPTRCGRLA